MYCFVPVCERKGFNCKSPSYCYTDVENLQTVFFFHTSLSNKPSNDLKHPCNVRAGNSGQLDVVSCLRLQWNELNWKWLSVMSESLSSDNIMVTCVFCFYCRIEEKSEWACCAHFYHCQCLFYLVLSPSLRCILIFIFCLLGKKNIQSSET